MKKFAGNRPLSSIKRRVKKNGWYWNDDEFRSGGDWVSFQFVSHGHDVQVLYNGFNGRFLIRFGGSLLSETSTEMDGVDWYDALLDFIYVPRRKTAQREGK